jgi:TonB family protein
MAKPDARILRIGILQGGKIVEERLLRKAEEVTIGQSPKNTFYVPISKLPRSLTLFEVTSGQYLMALSDQVSGRMSLDDQVADIASLAGHPKAARGKNGAVFPMNEKCRGKLVLGDITILFQFVQPPPVVPKPQLPASARGGIGYALMQESAFLMALLASLVVQGGFIALSIGFETPPDQVKKKNRFLQALKVDVQIDEDDEFEDKEEPDKKKPDEKEAEKDDEAEKPVEIVEPEPPPMPKPPKAQPKVAKTPPKKPEKTVTKSTAEAEKIKNRRKTRVQNNTILKHINSAAMGGAAGPDALADGHTFKIDNAFEGKGITVGKPGDSVGFRGGPKEVADGKGARVAKLDAKDRGKGKLTTGKVKSAAKKKKKERKVKLRVSLKGGRKSGGMGKLSGSAVTSVFKRRASAFRSCYESRLKVNPNISGKVTIRFTIGSAGRITNISVAKNTTGDKAVGRCIVGKVRGWRFSPPENGAVTFTYPIVLSKG